MPDEIVWEVSKYVHAKTYSAKDVAIFKTYYDKATAEECRKKGINCPTEKEQRKARAIDEKANKLKVALFNKIDTDKKMVITNIGSGDQEAEEITVLELWTHLKKEMKNVQKDRKLSSKQKANVISLFADLDYFVKAGRGGEAAIHYGQSKNGWAASFELLER